MRGRRVISLLLSLVMALSLCSGVWADNEPQGGGQQDNRFSITVGGKKMYFFTDKNGGNLSCNGKISEITVGQNNEIPAIKYEPVGSNRHLHLAFEYDGSFTNPSSLITVNEPSQERASVTYVNEADTGYYLFDVVTKKDLGNGEGNDFVDMTFHNGGSNYSFSLVFGRDNDQQGSEGGNQFAGVSEALKNAPDDAKAYGTKYLNNDTGRLNCQNSDGGGILVKDSYTDTEKEAIKSAVRAFRAFRDGQHDNTLNALGEMGDIDFDGKGWSDCFGHYLSELASRVGISLWSDDVQDGVVANVGNYTVTFYTNGDYGVFSLDTAAKVSVDNGKYTMSWDYEQIFFKVACSDENESRPALSYNNDTVQSIYHEGDRMEDGKKVYIYRVQLKRPNQEREVEFTIGNGESAPKFTVKFVDPNPWNPNDAFEAANAPAYVQELYKLGYRTPAYSTNFHLELPWQLHGTDNPSADGHWDYKWSLDKTTGIVTIELNTDHEECWKNCVENNTDIFTDGVYFHYWVGGSDTRTNPMEYGAHNGGYFAPADEPTEVNLDNLILTGDYEISNGWQLATVNKRSTTSTVLTFNAGTLCYFEGFAMSDNEDNNRKPMSSAEYKYIVQINVVTDKTKAVKLETEESQNVPKDRVTSFATVGGVDGNKWKCEVPEDGTAFVLYNGDDYTTASTVTQAYGNLVLTNLVGTLGFKVPNGYTTLNYVIDDHSGNYINSGNNGVNPLSVTAGNEVRFPVFKARYNSIKLIWSDSTGKTLTESLLVELGNATPWMELLSDNTAPATDIMDAQTNAFLQENGITVTYNEELGYFSTRVDASKLKDLSALNYAVDLTPMQGAAYFKVFGFGGSEAPFAHGQERAALAKANLDDWTTLVNPVSDLNSGVLGFFTQLLQTDSIKINVGNDELTVYFAANQLFRGGVIQWLAADRETVLGYTYVYGRNGDFVTSVPTETKAEVNEAVGAPTLEWNGQGDPGFTCDRNPQTGGNGSKVFFQFSVKHKDGISDERKAVIYLPYDYFGITAAEGMRRAARGERPVIYHYLDESCANEPEIIYGEYTPYGVRFETGSFSPFVVDCSTTSTTHRYHSTAAAKADSPETFDGGIALYGALAVTSLTGMAYVTKKRED